MDVLEISATLFIALCMGVVGFYLILIAKFYRLKFSRGPRPLWLQIGLALLLGGMLLRLPWFATFPLPVSQGMLTVGGLLFTWATYLLYRSMMTPQ